MAVFSSTLALDTAVQQGSEQGLPVFGEQRVRRTRDPGTISAHHWTDATFDESEVTTLVSVDLGQAEAHLDGGDIFSVWQVDSRFTIRMQIDTIRLILAFVYIRWLASANPSHQPYGRGEDRKESQNDHGDEHIPLLDLKPTFTPHKLNHV